MSRLLDWFGARNAPENPDRVAGTSRVSQNAPATWRSTASSRAAVNVAVAIRQMVMKILYESSRLEASTLGFLRARPKARATRRRPSERRWPER